MGLETCHRGAAVVQNEKNEVGPAMNAINKRWDCGMEKGRITACRQDWLLKSELHQLAQTIRHTNTRAHAMHRFKLLKAG
jgi:hypothetical protein